MNAMTLEQVRDWHRHQLNFLPESGVPTDLHQNAADAIDAHLAKTAKAVDVVAWRWRDNVRPGLPWDVTDDEDVINGMRRTGGYEIEPLTRALSGEKAGPVDGIAMAAAYIQKKADDYAAENCGTEWDTGATTYRYGQAGEDYHHTLLELAEEIAALPASPAPDKECQP